MEYDTELSKQLADELVDLWTECSMRCDRIEELLKQIKETEKWAYKHSVVLNIAFFKNTKDILGCGQIYQTTHYTNKI